MLSLCDNKNNINTFLNLIQRVFCHTKNHTQNFHKKAVQHTQKHKHRFLMYTHIVLLLLCFYFYNITTFQFADDVGLVEEQGIIIENEPEITPNQEETLTEEVLVEETEVVEEIVAGEVFSGEIIPEENFSGDQEMLSGALESLSGKNIYDLSGDVIQAEEGTGEVVPGNSTGVSVTGAHLISGDEEFFSGVVNELSGEILYNLSGEVVGDIHVESGVIVPVDLSGVSLLPQPLVVVYPEQSPILNASGYISLEALYSVITTGGEYGANYCSRIAYENITSILKAGVWTWRETNDFVLQGDADQLVIEGFEEGTMIEVTSGEVQEIFSGNNGTGYGYVYDLYISFMDFETKVYHRVAVVYTTGAEGSGWYVLDPLRGARITTPQLFQDYFAYYADEVEVQRYIGQAYVPSLIMEKLFDADDIRQLLGFVANEIDDLDTIEEQGSGDVEIELTGNILTGEILTGEILTGTEEIFTGSVFTGEIGSGTISTGTEILFTGETDNDIQEEVSDTGEEESIDDIIQGENSSEEVDTGETEDIIENYFTKAYTKGDYSEKIIELQKLLTWMQLYVGELNGIYSNDVIEAVYQYQLANSILTEQDLIGLRGYMGPSTRASLNQTYIQYQQSDISQEQTSSIGNTQSLTGDEENVTTLSGQEIIDEIGAISGLDMFGMFDQFFEIPAFSGLDIRLSECEKYDDICKKRITEKLLKEKGYTLTDKGLVQLSQDALIGSDTLDMDVLEGEFATNVIMQSLNDLSGNVAEVQIPEDTIVVLENGEIFTGEIFAPVFLDTEDVMDQLSLDIVAAVDVGTNEKIQFKNDEGEAMFVTFRVPAPGMNEGDTIDIYYSQDGQTQYYLTDVEVQLIDGEPYAIFEADHFTQFYLGDTIGTFVINNDDIFTTGLAVTLNSNVTGATHMRFGNTIAERDAASWVSYATGYARTFTGWFTGEVKRVYAQFSGNNVVRNVSDSIVYDINSGINTSGLELHLDSSTGGTIFYDIGPRNIPFTGISGPYKSTRSGEEVMTLDGSNDYIQSTSGFITNYPFTISAWVKPSRVNVIQALVMLGNSATNTTSYGIRLLNTGAPSAVAQNTTARTATSTTILQANKWYHIVGVFDSPTRRTIYVDNANPVTNTTTVNFSAANERRRIGRHPGISTTNYYSGSIDEVRVYNKSLTTGERQALYMVPPTFDTQTAFTGTPTLYGTLGDKILSYALVISGTTYPTTGAGLGKWKTLPITTGLANGTYDVTLNYTNVYGKTGTTIYTGGLIIDTTGATVTYNPSLGTTGSVVATLTGLDPTYMIVNNSGSELYTFTSNGSFTWQYVDKQGTTGSITATVDWIKDTVLTYSTGTFYENSLLNDGSISSSIIVVLSSGSFAVNADEYITLDNVPSGLTGVFTLSGTNQIIISLTGNATNHTSTESTGVVINFLTGAFVEFTPSQVGNTQNVPLYVQFIDAPDYFPGQQLWINGYLSGGEFYDWSSNHRPTTGTDVTTALQGSETYMSFNNATSYIDIGSYTLPNYTITARFRLNSFGTYDTLVGNGNPAVSTYELIDIYQNRITFYAHSQLQSTFTINAGERYHVALVQGSTGTSMYINGVFNTSTATRRELANAALVVGTDLYYGGQDRDGGIDEVKIYDSPLTSTQIENLYMVKPSFTPKETQVASPNIRGIVYDPQMDISLTISGTTYPATNNQDGTWQILAAGPFTGGTYDVQLNYTNVYGKTGMIYYTGGLIVDPTIYIVYDPATITSGDVVATLTGYDEHITIANNGGSPDYTFTSNGQFNFNLQELGGDNFNVTAIVDWIQKASISYDTGVFYEDISLNNGSIVNTIVATLDSDTFASNVITSGLIQMENLPAGLTGSYALSGNTQMIIGLSGNANSHTDANDVNNVSIRFLTGAFSTYLPTQIGNVIKTGIIIDFIDGSPGSGTLRLDGSYDGGTQFYDLAGSYLTTGINGIGNTTRSGETVMGPFNGTNQYINIGNYNLSTYTISAWFNSAQLGARRSIVADPGTSFEISQNPTNQIEVYEVITSNTSINANERYHVALVRSTSVTELYINGVLDNSNTTPKTINSALTVGLGYDTQYRSGLIDEVHIYDMPITAGQIKDLYLMEPSYQPKTEYTGTVVITGLVNDPKMYAVSVILSGVEYPCTVGSTYWSSDSIEDVSDGIYDVQVNYTNIYGKTGSVVYTGGLVVDTSIYVIYDPATTTSGSVVATLTGYDENVTITNNGGSPVYIFTGNGEFTFNLQGLSGNNFTVTAMVNRIKKASLSYSTTGWFETSLANDGTVESNIVVTLSSGSFASPITNYISLANLPSGLTGAYVLSGTQQMIVKLTGAATVHAAANSVSNITLTFLSGAFVEFAASEVMDSVITGLSLTFYDPHPTGGIYPSADTTLDADNEESHGCGAGVCQEYNYGALTYGGFSDFGSKMLMKFDMATIPVGATITSATLTLTKLSLGGIPTDNGTGFKLRKVINNSGWIEGTKSAAAASTGEPNYKQRKWTQEDWYNGDPGLVQSLDYESSELLAIGGFTGAAQAQYTQTMPLSAAGVATLQDWLDNPETNQGFALVEANQNWIYIATKERSTVGQRPLLNVSYVVDTTAPIMQTLTPADNSSGVVLDTDLNIIFSEYVTAVSGKNIIIKKSVDDSIVETINAANTGIVVLSNGNKTITVNPTSLLQSNTGYYIQIESGAFIDRASNPFTGITDTTTWNFTTVDADSVPTVISPSITGVQYTTATLGGTVTATGSSAVQELGVVWSTSPGFDIASANILSQTGTRNNPGEFSLSIAGFNSGSTIYFRAFAANEQGTGYSAETGFILKPDVVQFGTANMISNDTFMINRGAVTGAAYYEIYVSTCPLCTSYATGYGPAISTGTSKRIMGLEKETTYYYKAITVNSGGTSPVSEIHTIATSFLPRPRVRLKFEESAGTIAYDSSENFNHGVIYGTPLLQQTGAENKAYYFDAVDDFVAVTDFNMEPDLTVSFWFKKSTTGNNEHIFSRGNDTDANSINVIFDDATQSLRTYINGSQTILNVTGALYTGLLDDQRHFYSLTIADDESVPGQKLCTVFLDGITKLTDSSIAAGDFNPTPNINVGRRSISSAGTYYKGYVDDVRIYGKILTPPEINNLYLMFKDVTKPTATIEYVPSSLTSGDVVAILTGFSETGVTITNNGGLTGYTFTGNGTFTFTFRDEGFNTGEATATVTRIDKIKPTATIEYVPSSATTGTVVAILTGFSETGVTIANNGGLTGYTFTNNGSFTFEFIDLAGNTGSTTATVNHIKESALIYNTLQLFEDIADNDGHITGNIVITLSTGAFSGSVAQYIQINNLPSGLTGVYTLSGTNTLILSITGHTLNHNTGDSVSNISLEFLTGAFVDLDPYEVLNVVQTGISLIFYAPNPVTGIEPTDDTMLDADTDNYNPSSTDCSDGHCQRNNYGARSFLTVSQEGSKTVLRFNLSDVPPGFTINTAKLRLTRYNTTGVTYATGFELRQLVNNDDWIEGTKIGIEASEGEPNFYQRKWLQEDWFGGGPGLIPGYDYAASNLLTASYFTGSNTGTYTQEFFFNTSGIQALQTAANGTNYISFVITDPNEQYLSIYSKEASNPDYRPLLTFGYYADYTAPTVSLLVPSNNATGVNLDSNMFIEFSEAVTPVTGKNIYLRKSDGTLVETMSVIDTGKVHIIDPHTIVLINPTNIFQNFTGYYIEIDSGAFQDIAGNAFAGFTGSATWSFVTADMIGRATLTGAYYTGVTTTTATLGGTILTTGASTITERGIYWSTIEGFNGYVHGTKVSELGSRDSTGFFSLPVTDLPAGTRIYFEAFVENTQGHAHTQVGSFMTIAPQPIVLQETDIDYDTMTLNWISTGADTHMIYVSTGSDFATYLEGYGPLTGVVGDSNILTGLNAGITYYYKIVAVNEAGNSQESSVGSGTTTSYPIPSCWLQMDETHGTNAYDSSPYFHNGIILGSPMMNQSGIDGGAYCMDGINDQLSVVDFDYGSSYTIGFWFKSTGTGDNMHIFSHGGDNDPASLNVILDSTTQTLTTRYNGQAISVLGSDVYNEVTDGYRHYYVFAVDNGISVNPGFKTVAVRIDAIDYYTNSTMVMSSDTSSNNILMGRSSVAATGYFKGCIDDLRIRDLKYFYGDITFLNMSILYFYNIIGDHSIPTATPIYVPGSGTRTSGDVVATLTGYSNGLLIINNSGSNEHTFTGNDSFDFLAVNAAGNSVGNTGIITTTVTRIDKIPPTASVDYAPSSVTNGDVIATLTGFSETGVIITNNSGLATYTFTGNDSFTFEFVDRAGNTGSTTATVDRIDRTPPTATLEYAPMSGTFTTGDVVVTLTGFNKTGITITNNGGLATYTFTGNGSFIFEFIDIAGNTGSTTATVDWIDKTAPEIELLTPTSGTTILSGTLFSRSGSDNEEISGYILKVYSDTGVLLYARGLSGTTTGTLLPTIAYTYMTNGNYTWTITAVDTAGNEATAPEQVIIVDKDPPAIMTIYTEPALPIYNSGYDQNIEIFGDASAYPVRVTFKLYDGSGNVVSSMGEFPYYSSGSGIFPFSGSTLPDGIYELCADIRDASYNFTQGCVGNIIRDEFPPTATLEYAPTSGILTTGDVVVTLTGFNKTGITITNNSGLDTYIFTGNGSFTFEYVDERGRTGSMTATVDWIDKTAPEIELLTPTSGSTILSGTLFSRSGSDNEELSGYIFTVYSDTGVVLFSRVLSGTTTGVYLPMMSYTYMTNGNYTWTVTVVDTAGNSTESDESLFIVDKDPPAIMTIYTEPALPIYNSGYDQNIEIFGDASAYPVRVTFKLYDASGSVVSSIGEFPYYNSGSGFFTFSGSTLPDGIYELCADVRDASYNFTQGCVGNIIRDEVVPTYTGIVSGDSYQQYPAVNFSDMYLSGATLSGLNTSYYSGAVQTGSIADLPEGIYLLTIYDLAGNSTGVTFTIDRTPPTASVEYIPAFGEITGGTVSAVLTGMSEPIIILNNDGTGTYVFTENGSFIFEFMDLAGNTGSVKSQVRWIKPNLGTITGAELSTEYDSNIQYIGGYDTGTESLVTVEISNSTGVLYKNGIAITGMTATGMRDDEFYIRLISSVDPLTPVSSTMTIVSERGIVTGDFIIITKDIPITISAPDSFNFGEREASDQMFSVEKTFSGAEDYFTVYDRWGQDTGYYVTIDVSDMTTMSGDNISKQHISLKTFTGVTLAGSDNPRVNYFIPTDAYQYFGAFPLTFIKRDTAPNEGLTGAYGVLTTWKIDVPALQNVGEYTGVITYTLY